MFGMEYLKNHNKHLFGLKSRGVKKLNASERDERRTLFEVFKINKMQQ